MEKNCFFDSVDPSTFDKLLKEYPNVVPPKLTDLDEQRYETIPATLVKRASSGSPYLTKQEVAALVDWKLGHGKFRPTLKSLVQQNTEDIVQSTTTDGFSALSNDSKDSVKEALTILTRLRGIGPATASLLLSGFDPSNVPFFSDELFRWCYWDNGKGKGWDREIKYNVKEYLEVLERMKELRLRLSNGAGESVAAVDVEKVAYVLGKRGVDVGGRDSIPTSVDRAGEKPGKKRKAETDYEADGGAQKTYESINSRKDSPAKKTVENDTKGIPTSATTRPRRRYQKGSNRT